ncbi:PIG-L deacetylase family protein, partial [Spiribacter roseus]|uniref:PIG-L deacetylase family protein n=1 Tax=Spiribacter roseus TaxID=1855875 RepID=UPI001330F361
MTPLRTTLVIAAHPDDEALGCGGTIARWSNGGFNVHLAFLADGVGARGRVHDTEQGALNDRREAANKAGEIMGTASVHFDDLPDNRLDTVPLLDITQRVEALIERYQPDTVLTHHAGDLNIDHRRVHQAVMTACRPQPGHSVRTILCFEVPSSTEWQVSGGGEAFVPNWFDDITETLPQKLKALEAYATEMRDWPHTPSTEAVQPPPPWR